MERIYDFGGIYVLNLHPERAVSCKLALDILLSDAHNRPLPVWLARLKDISQWWNEHSQFRLHITSEAPYRWRFKAT